MTFCPGVNRRSPLAFGLASLLVLGCSTQGSQRAAELPRRAHASARSAVAEPGFARPAQVIPVSVWTATERRVIASGLRAERTSDGSVQVARDLLPGGDELVGLELPPRLGSGFVFVSRGQSAALWRSTTWTSRLEPLATVETRVDRVEAGFDRLYLLSRRETRALDANTGETVGLGALPPAASFRELRFGESWTGLAEVPVAGVLVTFDGGQQWWPVPGARTVLAAGPELLVTTDAGVASVGSAGTLTPLNLPEDPEGGELPLPEAFAPDRRVMQEAVLRGVYLGGPASGPAQEKQAKVDGKSAEPGGERALVVVDTDLLVVDVRRGTVVSRRRSVVSPGTKCQGVRFSGGHGFVCQGPAGATWVASAGPEHWRTLHRFAEPRAVLATGPAGALFEGPCGGASNGASKGVGKGVAKGVLGGQRRICVVTGEGTVREQDVLPEPAVVASSASGVLSLMPPRAITETSARSPATARKRSAARKTTPGVRGGEFVNAAGKARSLRLPEDEELQRLLTLGTWLPGPSARDGGLSLWVVAGDRFAGVRVSVEGRVEVGPVQKPARRALLSERFGLLWGAAGFAKETVDGGQTWHETSLPYRTGDADPTQPPDAGTTIELGCSAAGCVLGPWIRIGWNAGLDGTEAPWGEAAAPPVRFPPAAESGRWRLQCRPSGRSSRPFADDTAQVAPRSQRRARALPVTAHDAETSAGWQSFWEWRAPTLPRDAVGYSLGSHLEQARLYTSGPAEGSWGERGKLQVGFVDPFSIEAVRLSPIARPPWSDARRAALAFGDQAQSGISHLYSALDPARDGGLMLLRSSSGVDLFVFEAERGPEVVRGAEELGLGALEDAVRVGEAWFTLQRVGSTLRVLRVRGGQIEELTTLQLGRGEAPWARIVRTASGIGLGLFVEGEAGRVVYPIDPRRGDLGAPLRIPKIGAQPRPCADAVDGYVLTTELSPPPNLSVAGTVHPVDLARVTAQLVVGGPEVCVAQLSSSTRDLVQISPSSVREGGALLTMTVTEQRAGGRRWEMMCR